MATVFTENMNRIDPSDTERSLTVLETYIRYMQERIEFASANMARSVSAAGVSSVEVAARRKAASRRWTRGSRRWSVITEPAHSPRGMCADSKGGKHNGDL